MVFLLMQRGRTESKQYRKVLTSDLSFTIIGERKVTLVCLEVIMASGTKEGILEDALEQVEEFSRHFIRVYGQEG